MSNKKTLSDEAADLRRQAEQIHHEKSAQLPENFAPSPAEIRQMFHELRVHQIELEMQNEELRRTEVELDAARARYFDLYDLAPIGYCTVSQEGLILEANLTAAGLLGVARGALTRRPLSSFVLPEDKDLLYLHHKKLFEIGEPQASEVRMVKKDGTAFWARLVATTVGGAGDVPVCRVVMSDITERKRAEEAQRESVTEMKRAVQEKIVMLQEIHHRVKNNLAVVSSLLSMQAEASESSEVRVALDNSQHRVHSMALIHQLLYESGRFDRVDFSKYAPQLVRGLCAVMLDDPDRVAVQMELEPIELTMDRAVPCALILNELLSNALKYAFAGGRNGRIGIFFRQPEPGWYELAVEDDGVGLSADAFSGKNSSLGLRIVHILTSQLDGSAELKPCAGTRIVLRFPAAG